jgi:hypothetical protein
MWRRHRGANAAAWTATAATWRGGIVGVMARHAYGAQSMVASIMAKYRNENNRNMYQ